MPANYAHYRFGKLVLGGISGGEKQCIQRFRRMFDMGLLGADIFFYYNPLTKNAVGELCGKYHGQTGKEFFAHACTVATSEAARAYLYGLLGHYCLDRACHPVVEKAAAEHVALEAEFDRYLMEKDGIAEPHTYDMSKRFKLTRGECMTVAEFYPGATGANVSISVRHLGWLTRGAAGKNREKLKKLLKKVKPGLLEGFVPEEPVERYARMDSELLARFNRAVKEYPELLQELVAAMENGEELGEKFAENFG